MKIDLVTMQYQDHPFFYRRVYGDQAIILENLLRPNAYGKRVPLNFTDVVLDIGAHIGAFAVYAAHRCAQVVCYEPDHDNFVLLGKNTFPYTNTELHESAVRGRGGEVTFYPAGKNTGTGSTYPVRGRPSVEVNAVGIGDVLSKHEFTYIKCDIEGGEYTIFNRLILQPQVRAVVMEVHLNHQEYRAEAHTLVEGLVAQGFAVDVNLAVQRWTILSAVREGR